MAVFDQFDVEPVTSFEGSYIDNVFLISGSQNKVLASKVSGLDADAFEPAEHSYATALGFFSGSRVGRISRAAHAFDELEYCSDTFTPHPFSIMHNNIENPSFWRTSTQELQIEYRLEYSLLPSQAVTDDATADNIWHLTFPFEKRYTQILKNMEQNPTSVANIVLSKGFSMDDYEIETITPPSSSITFLPFVILFGPPSETGLGTGVFFANGATLLDWSSSLGPRPDPFLNQTPPGYSSLSQTFFGIGDGGKRWGGYDTTNEYVNARLGGYSIADAYEHTDLNLGRYQPLFGTAYPNQNPNLLRYVWMGAPIIRGFKYGIKNSIAERVGTRWNRNHFGHLRDMFEPRTGHATLNRKTGRKLYVPLEVSFVSGSQSAQRAVTYLSASSSVDFNPRDSGIYDRYYRSGQPFFE